MTKPNSRQWRMPLFVLALILVASLQFFTAGAAADDVVTITTFPKDYQLYPRDGSDKGTVTVAGNVVSSSTDKVRVDVLRNGVAYSSTEEPLSYSGGSADFSVDVTIDAELADYTIKLYTVDGGVDAHQATADYVVAGDVFVIQGQSNAVGGMYTNDDDADPNNNPAVMSSISAQNDYVRTFSSSTGDPAVLQLDNNWYVADGDGFNGPGTIGQWGLKMGDSLVDTYGVPLAIINGAFGGEEITFFQRDDDDTQNLDTNYGRLLYRMENSGLKGDIKAIFWYQGESDEGDVEQHLNGFDDIYQDWKADFPAAQRIYAFQIADFCFGDNIAQREAQRRLPETYSDVTILSTNAIKGHRLDCHYWWQDGYETLGEQAALIVGRDFYGGSATAVDAPDLERAYFSEPDAGNQPRTEVTLQLKNVDNGFNFDDFTSTTGNTALYRFAFTSDNPDEFIQMSLKDVDTVNGQIVFDIQIGWTSQTGPIPPTGNVTVQFKGDDWLKMGKPEADEDNVTNSNGIGLLSFNAKVFESVDAPEAVFYSPTPLQATLTGSSVGFDLKGGNSTDPNGDGLQYRWNFVNPDGSLSDPIGYSADKYLFIDTPGTYEINLSVYDGNPDDPNTNSDFVREKILVFADTTNACTQHGLNYDRFDNVAGTKVNDLVNAGVFATPSSHSYIEDFEIPANIGDSYGAYVRGYIVPPISGDYEFWVASDDEGFVWIHSATAYNSWTVNNNSVPDIRTTLVPTLTAAAQDLTPKPTVYVEGFSSPELQFVTSDSPWNGRQWTAGVEFDAYEIFTKTLEVGKLYYVEALYKEGGAGDHMSLGWKLPGAKDYTLIENSNLCVARTDLPLAPLPVINASIFNRAPSNDDELAGEAPLTILFDGNQSTDADGDINNASFTWSFGDGVTQTTSATSHQYRTPGTYYSVLTVTDEQGYTNNAVEKIEVLEPDCSGQGKGISFERFDNIGGRLISDMLLDENFTTGIPSYKARLNSFEMPENVGDEYAARFRGYITPPSTGGYTFRVAGDDQVVVLLSTDDTRANIAPIAAVTNYTGTLTFNEDPNNTTIPLGIPGYEGWTFWRSWLASDASELKYPHQQSQMVNLTQGQRYYVEVLYKEELFGDHMSLAWQKPGSVNFDLILCNDVEPYTDEIHNLEVSVETSQTTVPASGALIEYRIHLKNDSSTDLLTDPIQIESIVDSLHGDIASTAAGWQASFAENTCWWWVPELFVGQEWTCSYTKWVSGPGQIHNITVSGTSQNGKVVSEVAEAEYIGDAGPGVKTTAEWAAEDIGSIGRFTQLVDTDGELDIDFNPYAADVRDTVGILIGDYDFDGVCDMWQTWWLRNCIAVSESDIETVLDDTSSTDMRVKMLRSLIASWLNIAAGNEYECSDMRTSVNLALIWLDTHGNPLEGGTPIGSTSYDWTQIEYAQIWFEWFNDTGGNSCSGQDDGSTASCGALTQEAELGTIYGNRMTTATDSGASAGAYLYTPNSVGSKWSPHDAHRTDFCVTIAQDGWYAIDGWTRSPDGGRDNSFFVQFNDGTIVLWDTLVDKTNFVQGSVTSRDHGGGVVNWWLPAGDHTLTFYLRENGTQLDQFEVALQGTRSGEEVIAVDAGTPLAQAEPTASGRATSEPHYFLTWLEEGNNGNGDSGDYAAALAGFVADTENATEQDSVEVSGAVGYIEGNVDIAPGTEEMVHESGVDNFAPESIVVPTAVSMNNITTAATPSAFGLIVVLISTLTIGMVGLRKRK